MVKAFKKYIWVLGLFVGLGLWMSGLVDAKGPGDLWEVETLGTESFASHPKYPKLRLPLKVTGAGNPVVKDWAKAPQGEDLYVLSYLAGEVGTSERVKVLRALVVNIKRSEVLTDEILNYVDPRNESKVRGPQPEWNWSPGVLLIQKTDTLQPIQVNLRASKLEESGASEEAK